MAVPEPRRACRVRETAGYPLSCAGASGRTFALPPRVAARRRPSASASRFVLSPRSLFANGTVCGVRRSPGERLVRGRDTPVEGCCQANPNHLWRAVPALPVVLLDPPAAQDQGDPI